MSAPAIDVGQAVARKGKRQRRQKTEEEQEEAAAQQEEEVEQEAEQQAKRAKKSEKKGAAAASVDDADGDAAMAEPAAAEGDEAAAADGGDAAVEENKSGQVGSGYLKPEVLLYFKNLAEILEKNEFESEEGQSHDGPRGDATRRRLRCDPRRVRWVPVRVAMHAHTVLHCAHAHCYLWLVTVAFVRWLALFFLQTFTFSFRTCSRSCAAVIRTSCAL